MAEYIDRQELLENLNKFAPEHYSVLVNTLITKQPAADVVSMGVFEQVRWERDVAIDQLKSYGVGFAEKADVARVKHGKWFSLKKCSNAGVYCSVCRKKVYKERYANPKLLPKYCPECGAKMDGERKADDV